MNSSAESAVVFCWPWSRYSLYWKWVVYAKPPFGGPEHVLHYLARYTHRVAISNHRLIQLADGQVTFRWKDYAHGNKKRKMTISANEFLQRFMLHVLPKGFLRIRFFGFLAHRRRALLPHCQQLLAAVPPTPHSPVAPRNQSQPPGIVRSVAVP